jgi:quercetin dioxygenase-like cupin family protein
LLFALYEHPGGIEVEDGLRVVYDLEQNEAHFGAARVPGAALEWRLDDSPGRDRDEGEAALAVQVGLDERSDWVVRCDRVDFPPGGVAYRHVHPGPGIRRLLFGELTIESPEGARAYSAGEAWFEGRDHPVVATASATDETAFVRVLLLPGEWAGKRTIRYLDPADDEKPRLQKATVFLEQPIEP